MKRRERLVLIENLTLSQIFTTLLLIVLCSVLVGMFSKEEWYGQEEIVHFMNASVHEQRRSTISFTRRYCDNSNVEIYVTDRIGETRDFLFNNWFIFSVTATLTETKTNIKNSIYKNERLLKRFNMVRKDGVLASDPVKLLELHIPQESILNITMKITATGDLFARDLIFTICCPNLGYHDKIERTRIMGSLILITVVVWCCCAGNPNSLFTGVALIGVVISLKWGSSRQRAFDVLYEKVLFAFIVCGYSITSRKMRIEPIFLVLNVVLTMVWALFDLQFLGAEGSPVNDTETKDSTLERDATLSFGMVLLALGYAAVLMSQGMRRRKSNLVLFGALVFFLNIMRPFLTRILLGHVIVVNKCRIICGSLMMNYLVAAFGVYSFTNV